MPPVQARKSYTAAFKLEVIKYAEENGNRAADREFGVNEKKRPTMARTERYSAQDKENSGPCQ